VNEVKWIKISTGLFDNRKIKQIEQLPEGDAIIVVWVKLLCLAGLCNKNGMIYFTDEIPYTEEMLAIEFNMQQRYSVLKLALRTFEAFKMIDIIDNVFFITSWDKYQNIEGLEKIREQNRKRKQRQRENQKLLECHVTSNVTRHIDVTQCHATDIDKEIDKDIHNKNIVQKDCTVKVTKSEIDSFFETVWKLYPNKKGKGQISDAKKKKLFEIGFNNLSNAILRYKQELAKDEWRKEQNGSTFFNSGYEDYLDVNYVPSENKPQSHQPQQSNKFNQFPQRNYSAQDYANLERHLLNKNNQHQDNYD
jgi:predicted phage replisome organizer